MNPQNSDSPLPRERREFDCFVMATKPLLIKQFFRNIPPKKQNCASFRFAKTQTPFHRFPTSSVGLRVSTRTLCLGARGKNSSPICHLQKGSALKCVPHQRSYCFKQANWQRKHTKKTHTQQSRRCLAGRIVAIMSMLIVHVYFGHGFFTFFTPLC